MKSEVIKSVYGNLYNFDHKSIDHTEGPRGTKGLNGTKGSKGAGGPKVTEGLKDLVS